jgi:putative endonuclease
MYTYIIKCKDGSLYTGVASDVKKRMKEHLGLEKGGAKYTKSRPPVYVCAVWESENRSMASRLEYYIKRLTRYEKLELINSLDLSSIAKIDASLYVLKSEYIGKISLDN